VAIILEFNDGRSANAMQANDACLKCPLRNHKRIHYERQATVRSDARWPWITVVPKAWPAKWPKHWASRAQHLYHARYSVRKSSRWSRDLESLRVSKAAGCPVTWQSLDTNRSPRWLDAAEGASAL